MRASIATVTLEGIAPYSQSFKHDEPRLEGENADAYDVRTWRAKMTVDERDGRRSVVIPAHGLHQALASAARYSKRQVPGQGKATWTKKFESGISILENPRLDVAPDDVPPVVIYANADGIRGSNKRVTRRFPLIPNGWRAEARVYILDAIITEDVFREMVEIAGMFVGIGRFRPEKGGTNGRFRVAAMQWADNRQLVAA